jgi:hypothetical protein
VGKGTLLHWYQNRLFTGGDGINAVQNHGKTRPKQ